jgi:hypothetical protein
MSEPAGRALSLLRICTRIESASFSLSLAFLHCDVQSIYHPPLRFMSVVSPSLGLFLFINFYVLRQSGNRVIMAVQSESTAELDHTQ